MKIYILYCIYILFETTLYKFLDYFLIQLFIDIYVYSRPVFSRYTLTPVSRNWLFTLLFLRSSIMYVVYAFFCLLCTTTSWSGFPGSLDKRVIPCFSAESTDVPLFFSSYTLSLKLR